MYGIPELWQIYTLADVAKQQEIVSELKKINPEANSAAPQKTNYRDVLKVVLPKHNRLRFEDSPSLLRRAGVIDEFFREYLRMNPLEGD